MAYVNDYISEDTGLIKLCANAFLPDTVLVPLKLLDDENSSVLIKEGDVLEEGQVIAKNNVTSVHSTIPGQVLGIQETVFNDNKKGLAARIKFGGKLNFTGKKFVDRDWLSLPPFSIVSAFSEFGVINTFNNEGIELNQQIRNFDESAARLVIVRLYDEDPSRILDKFLCDNYFEKIKTGAEIIARALKANGIVFAGEADKDYDISVKGDIKAILVKLDSKKYPNGYMHEIVQEVKKQFTSTVFNRIGNRDLFVDVQTAICVYDAVVNGIPSIYKYVHVTGDCLNAGAVMKVRIGTLLKDLTEGLGGFKRKPGKIIINGLIAGNSVDSMNIPVGKNLKSVAFIPEKQIPDQVEVNCTRCGNCHAVCPVGIYPESLLRLSYNKDYEDLENVLIKQTSLLCTGCGLCNAACPSRINLSQIIETLKD